MVRLTPFKRVNNLESCFMPPIVLILIFLGTLSFGHSSSLFAQPETALKKEPQLHILSSIKPIHLIVKAIATPNIQLDYVIDPNRDPHHYQLKPSDLQKIAQADLIIRVSPSLEGILDIALAQITREPDSILTLANIPHLQLYPLRHAHAYDKHGTHGHHHLSGKNNNNLNAIHGNGNQQALKSGMKDMHFWLDIGNVKKIATVIKRKLVALHPREETKLEYNYTKLLITLEHLNYINQQRFALKHNKPYMVDHDALQYFEKPYHLNMLGALSAHDAVTAGARSLYILYNKSKAQQLNCLITSQKESSLMHSLSQKTHTRITYIDLNASHHEHFVQYMQHISDAFKKCLSY